MEQQLKIGQGQLSGVRESGVSRFLGIPYAAPPFGSRRMKPPESPLAWSGVRDVTRYGPTVPKSPYPAPYDGIFEEPDIPGEDCLNLSVWTPDPAGLYPVFVWIHGGAFTNGSNAVPQYDGTAFARHGVVCVTINYRLGADGFLDTGDAHTNIGILDQTAALRWVKDNIADFGGDPSRVTIGGESAGAMSVATLLASPLAGGLFHGAILQSGAGHHAISRSTAQRVAEALAVRLGLPPNRDALAAAPVADLLAAQAALSTDIQMAPDPGAWGEIAANLMAFEPVIDQSVVTGLPIDGIRKGAGAGVPVLIGTNRDEQLLFLAPSGALGMVTDQVLRLAAAGYGFSDPDDVIALYAKENGQSPGHTLAALAGDWFFRIPAIRLAEARAAGPAPTYVYEFRWESRAMGGILGSCHYLEVPFVFDSLDSAGADRITGRDAPQQLAEEMHQTWVRFIVEGEAGWAAYSPAHRAVGVFGGSVSTEDDPGGERRQIWDGLR